MPRRLQPHPVRDYVRIAVVGDLLDFAFGFPGKLMTMLIS
jgi:hypothetical protein